MRSLVSIFGISTQLYLVCLAYSRVGSACCLRSTSSSQSRWRTARTLHRLPAPSHQHQWSIWSPSQIVRGPLIVLELVVVAHSNPILQVVCPPMRIGLYCKSGKVIAEPIKLWWDQRILEVNASFICIILEINAQLNLFHIWRLMSFLFGISFN